MDDEYPIPRWNYNTFWCEKNQTHMIRANFWSEDGHSTQTLLTMNEVHNWIQMMKNRKRAL